MRVISGNLRGLKLESLPGMETRPTLDRVKEALFNILQDKIRQAEVLDLFAGSGAIGIEAFSRGAKTVTFCDNAKGAIQIIQKNIQKARMQEKATVVVGDYSKVLKVGKKYDIIFLDPPYQSNLSIEVLKKILQYNNLNENAILVIETDDEKKVQEGLEKQELPLEIYDTRKYGRVRLMFMRKG